MCEACPEMINHNDEEAEQRRLEREARTVLLGTLGVPAELTTDTAKVEVSYWRRGDIQRAGHFIVRVATVESEALEEHPANIASDIVYQWSERNGPFEYFSVDDVYAE